MCPLSRGPPACPGSGGSARIGYPRRDPVGSQGGVVMSTAQQIGVPSESRAGETRVAATPKTVEQLRGLGYEVVVESGAGARASFADAAYEEAGARVASQDEVWASDLVLKINAPSDEEIARLRDGGDPGQPGQPGDRPRPGRQARGPPDHRPGHGRGAADLPRAVARRAQLDGQHRGVPRGHRGGPRVRQPLHRPGHRRRQGPAGEGPRRRRRRRGTRRDRYRRQPRRGGARLRRPPGGRRAGRVDGRRVPPGRAVRGGVAGQRRRLRPADVRGLRPQGRRAVCGAGRRRRHHHHHRADPRPSRASAHHGGDGRHDEARQRHRRHGRRERRQLRAARSPTRWSSATTACGSSATPTWPGGCRRSRRSCSPPTSSTCSSCSRRARTGSRCSTWTTRSSGV